MTTVLFLGLLIGMKHALEADHIAAVASLASRFRTVKDMVKVGLMWGAGHTLTLVLVGTAVLTAGGMISERTAQALEFVVGGMLVVLGVDVLIRMLRERVHFHAHRHGDGTRHFHAHAHAGEAAHDPLHHEHAHPRGLPVRALFVGLMHGMAGSAALILLTLETLGSATLGLAYIALFGLGSMVGMAALSAVIAVPLRFSAQRATWVYNGLRGGIGLLTLGLGILIMYRIGSPAELFLL